MLTGDILSLYWRWLKRGAGWLWLWPSSICPFAGSLKEKGPEDLAPGPCLRIALEAGPDAEAVVPPERVTYERIVAKRELRLCRCGVGEVLDRSL